MVAAIMGAKARLGHAAGGHRDDYKSDKAAAEKKKKTTITADSFDRQVADKMGGFFETVLWVALTLAAVGGFVAGFLLGRKRYRT